MIPDAVALWTGRVMLLLWAGLLVGVLAALARLWFEGWFVGRRRARPTRATYYDRAGLLRAAQAGSDQRDYGDETDVVPPEPPLYCLRCGRRVSPSVAWNSCADCGGRFWGSQPNLPILGEPRELR